MSYNAEDKMKILISITGLFINIAILLLLLELFPEHSLFITLLSPFFGYFCGRCFTKLGIRYGN